MNVDRNDPTLGDAMSALAEMEASQAAENGQPQAQPEPSQTLAQPTPESATEAERASQPEPEQAQRQDQTTPSTPSTEAKPTEQAKAPQGTEGQSKFAKNQARLEGGWKQLNESKAEFQKNQEAIKAREQELTRREKALESERIKLQQPKYRPEDYETGAGQLEANAAQMETEATRRESNGDFDGAQKLRDEARFNRLQAKKAREYAANIRANPPPAPQTDAQAEEEYKAQQKEWWGKALVDFPKVGETNSPEANALKELIKSEPAVVNDPKGMYYAARLVTAEASAAHVPGMEKELTTLRAKVDELSKKLSVPGEGAVTTPKADVPFEQRTEDEQERDLYAAAGQIDARGL